MFNLFLYSCRLYVKLFYRTLVPAGGSFNHRSIKRLAVMLLFLPFFGLIQLIHWLGLLLDEIFFRGYRDVAITEPLFVLGPPRSGTTFLHRALAEDEQFTTFTTWECLFALSITQRKIWLSLAAVDRFLGGAVARFLQYLEKSISEDFSGIHRVSLSAPEEDYFTLMPIMASFILVLPFPFEESIWRMAAFDRDVAARDKKRIMAWYKAMLQKHLYVHGPEKTLLSKNAAFASLIGSLKTTFPDARFLCCMRDPMESLPSQLSAIQPGLKLFAVEPFSKEYQSRFIELFHFYYEHLIVELNSLPDLQHQFVDMQLLQRDLAATVTASYHRLGLTLTAQQSKSLDLADASSRAYRSTHHYSLASLGLDRRELEHKFSAVYRLYDFDSADKKFGRQNTLIRPAQKGQSDPVAQGEICYE